VYASLFPAGGGFAELALASADRLAPMPGGLSFPEAAGLVISAGTAHEGLVDRGRLQAGQSVLITAAAGGVGSAAVQIAAAAGARVFGVASPANNDYLRSLGPTQVFDYHAADWAKQVRAAVPGGIDLLLGRAGGQTRDQAIGAVRDGGRAGPRGAGAGRGRAHSWQDRAANRALATAHLGLTSTRRSATSGWAGYRWGTGLRPCWLARLGQPGGGEGIGSAGGLAGCSQHRPAAPHRWPEPDAAAGPGRVPESLLGRAGPDR
jgi:threonine dehydrogenase-like Zn-dependent dehydrogenase